MTTGIIISFVPISYSDYTREKEHFSQFQVGTWGDAGETELYGDIAMFE